MNGVEENLLYLQSIRNKILKKEVFLECKGLRVYEDELKRGKRGEKIGLWLEYISKVKNNISMVKEGSYHDMEYISEENDLNREIGLENVELDEVERLNLGNLDLNLLYKYDYCLVLVRRALNWSSRREVSIWKEYLSLLEEFELFLEKRLGKELVDLDISDEYESCLKSCNDVDLWLSYSRYLFKNKVEFTRSRHVLDRSLKLLPLNTHHKIWNQYLEYITSLDIPILSISVLRRFLLFSFKDGIEPYIQALVKGDQITECLNELFGLIKQRIGLDYSVFKNGIEVNGSRHKVSGMDDLFNLALIILSENVLVLDKKIIEDYANKLIDEKLNESMNDKKTVFSPILNTIGTDLNNNVKNDTNASQINSMDLNNRGYKLTFGELVCRVSQIYMKLANWKKVYEIYYFGIEKCVSVYDFTVIYDSMMMFSSIYMNRLLCNREESANCNTQLSDSPSFISSLKELSDESLRKEFERLEKIVNDHNCLLYKTMVRCEKDNVSRWIEYINAFVKEERKKNRPEPSIEVVKLFEEAINTIDFNKIKDKSRCIFWVFYANYMTSSIDNGNEILEYNKGGKGKKEKELLELSREVFERALLQPYIEDYTLLWTEWVEMELRFGNYECALELVRRCLGFIKKQKDKQKTINNPRIWQLSSDIEISFGTPESVWSLIEELFDSGMSTSSLIISFGDYFKRKGLYDEAFTLYERAIGALEMPYSFNICLDLINSFMYRYCGVTIQKLFDLDKETEFNINNTRIERIREIFEYSISALNEWKLKLRIKELDSYYEYVFILYSIYGVCETNMGRKKRAYDVFERAIRQLDEQDKYKVIVYIRWINLTLRCSDIEYTRSIFDSAIESLKTADVIIKICIKYVNFELNMGEINRVRSIFLYASEFVPKIYLQENQFSLYNKFWTSWSYFECEYGDEDTLRDLLRIQKNVPLVSGHSVYSNSNSSSLVGSSPVFTKSTIHNCNKENIGDDTEDGVCESQNQIGAEKEDKTTTREMGIGKIHAVRKEQEGSIVEAGAGREPFGILDDTDFKNYQYEDDDEEQVSDQEYDASNTFVETDSDDDLLLSLSSEENSGNELADTRNNNGNSNDGNNNNHINGNNNNHNGNNDHSHERNHNNMQIPNSNLNDNISSNINLNIDHNSNSNNISCSNNTQNAHLQQSNIIGIPNTNFFQASHNNNRNAHAALHDFTPGSNSSTTNHHNSGLLVENSNMSSNNNDNGR
ncbi:hypothetical protein RS030_3480 [Cryptosporidium xiaoi]|uniref:Uncharacterized protein n=1 Tax=Cryptosporidium xiaoi TaxID=659607 RepID=A0AAV9XVU4_9CRYT